MRKELKIIGSKERHVFTATFIRFGFRDGYKGPVKTILLQDVLLDGKEVQKKCTDKYEYIYLPKDPFKKHPNKKGECYLIRRGEV